MKFKSLLFTSAISFALISCGGTEEGANTDVSAEGEADVSTEVVTNDASAEGEIDPTMAPAFKFESETHDFGEITQGESVEYSFTFTNTGRTALVISSAKGSCGCTVPEYSSDPVGPGETGKIDVVFNSKGKTGGQNKKVTLIANTVPNQAVLTITGNVIVPVVVGGEAKNEES